MSLPDSYTVKPGSIPAYFEAFTNAEAPERFTIKFLENLEFKSTNDRLIVGVLKDLGFLDADGIPQQRYFEFLDKHSLVKSSLKEFERHFQIFLQLTKTPIN